jgi:uncharacterized protein
MAVRLCPHCYASMQRCVRDGVVMDLCIQCGGIFLDGGELEHLIVAASAPDAGDSGDRVFRGGSAGYGRRRKRALVESFFGVADHRAGVATRRDAQSVIGDGIPR